MYVQNRMQVGVKTSQKRVILYMDTIRYTYVIHACFFNTFITQVTSYMFSMSERGILITCISLLHLKRFILLFWGTIFGHLQAENSASYINLSTFFHQHIFFVHKPFYYNNECIFGFVFISYLHEKYIALQYVVRMYTLKRLLLTFVIFLDYLSIITVSKKNLR